MKQIWFTLFEIREIVESPVIFIRLKKNENHNWNSVHKLLYIKTKKNINLVFLYKVIFLKIII